MKKDEENGLELDLEDQMRQGMTSVFENFRSAIKIWAITSMVIT